VVAAPDAAWKIVEQLVAGKLAVVLAVASVPVAAAKVQEKVAVIAVG
jgi:hypothetical protein